MSVDRRAALGLAIFTGLGGLGAPVAAAGKDDIPQPIATPGEMRSLKTPLILQISSPDLPVNQEPIKPDFELFDRIIDASLNPTQLKSLLERIYEDLSKNPEEHFGFRQELGAPGLASQFIYTHPYLELAITDPQGSENFLGQFILTMQALKPADDFSGIVEPTPNLFTEEEQKKALEFFNASDELREKAWIPRQIVVPNGLPGVFRGFWDANNMLHAQDATIEGQISYTGVYRLSEIPGSIGSGDSSALIQVQP